MSREQRVSPEAVVYSPKAECTVRPCIRLAAIPVDAQVMKLVDLTVNRARRHDIRNDLPVPALPLMKRVKAEFASNARSTCE